MRQPLNTIGTGETIRSLSQLGITTDPVSGDLKLDTDKLSKALTNHGADVAALFQGEDGIAAKVENTTKQMLEDSSAGSGLFKNLEENINRNIKSLKKQYEAASLRLEDQMAVYTAQFTALDAAVTKMSSVSTYLTEQLAQLKKNTQSS
jgi:flagellar hook-associated protein 2